MHHDEKPRVTLKFNSSSSPQGRPSNYSTSVCDSCIYVMVRIPWLLWNSTRHQVYQDFSQLIHNCIRLRQTPWWKIPVPLETQPLASYTASCYDSTTMSKPGTHHHESRTAALIIKFSSSPASQPAVLSSQPSHSCRCEFKLYSDTHLSPVFPLPASYIQYFTLFFS